MDLAALLIGSRATDSFKSDVLALAQGRRSARTVEWSGASPPVKVLRVLAHLVEQNPDLPIERVRVQGWSGCSDYRGSVHVETGSGERAFDFVWCCRWRAREEGWTDPFGFPDQMRAAREFGHRCFERWTERT